MKLSLGKAIVREDLWTMVQDGVFNMWTDMLQFAGKEVNIIDARDTKWGERYTIEGSPRSWTAECFVTSRRETKRKAEAGELIKLTYTGYDFNELGDILPVHKVHDTYVTVLNSKHPRDTGLSEYDWAYCHDEYVVVTPNKTPLSEYTIEEISAELLRRYGDVE